MENWAVKSISRRSGSEPWQERLESVADEGERGRLEGRRDVSVVMSPIPKACSMHSQREPLLQPPQPIGTSSPFDAKSSGGVVWL